jgi:hypothetical protein
LLDPSILYSQLQLQLQDLCDEISVQSTDEFLLMMNFAQSELELINEDLYYNALMSGIANLDLSVDEKELN